MSKKIVFLLPWVDYDPDTGLFKPIGGYKVIYEYANRFILDGYSVTLAYPHISRAYPSFLRNTYAFFGNLYRKIVGDKKAAGWFPLDPRVRKVYCFKLSNPWFHVDDDAIVVATAYETALELLNIKNVPICRKVYFIQGFETWADSEQNVIKSYAFGFRNIVIAPWLADKVRLADAESKLVLNGFDMECFSMKIPVEQRYPYEVVLMNHTLAQKRVDVSMQALARVKSVIPELHVTMFGTCESPQDLPSYYTYIKLPDSRQLTEIYNNGAIYLTSAVNEGFGLTVGEAMICGCAVVCTNDGGFRSLVTDNVTGLISDIDDVKGISQNIISLIIDNEKRIRLALSGQSFIKNFTIDRAYHEFKHIIDEQY